MSGQKEADYEPLFKKETRRLTSKRTGEQHVFTLPKIYWHSFEAIQKYPDTTFDTLLESAQLWAKTDGELEDTFLTKIYCTHAHFEHYGRPVDAMLPPKPITYWPSIGRWSSPKWSE